jgi:hypothetical protein
LKEEASTGKQTHASERQNPQMRGILVTPAT